MRLCKEREGLPRQSGPRGGIRLTVIHKSLMKRSAQRYITLPRTGKPEPSPGARPGRGAQWQASVGPGWAQPEKATWSHHPEDPPPAKRAIMALLGDFIVLLENFNSRVWLGGTAGLRMSWTHLVKRGAELSADPYISPGWGMRDPENFSWREGMGT